MSKDYKASARPRRRGGSGSSLLAGILIGLVLGLGIALGVAWYINKVPNPFSTRQTPAPTPLPKAEAPKSSPSQTARLDDKAKADDSKPRFDYHKILPGEDVEKAAKDAQKGSTAAVREAFFLQAGAFQNARDADDMKARLALLGIEARIETSSASDKGVLHRVRVGPYTSVEELNRTRDTLKQNDVATTLVRVKEPER